MDEIKLGQAQARGAQSYELLNSKLLQDAFSYLENEYLTSWRNSTVRDERGRENLFLAIRVLDHVRTHLKTWVENGKIASKDLANIKYTKR